MINVRQVANIQKEGSTFTLVDVKVFAENLETDKRATAQQAVNTDYTNVSSLFTAIQDYTTNLLQSGLV